MLASKRCVAIPRSNRVYHAPTVRSNSCLDHADTTHYFGDGQLHTQAGHYFNVKRVYVPIDPVTLKASVLDMERAITKNTILIVGSAPQYPHGVIDPIGELGVIAQRHKLPLHVDACVGGFVLPWLEKLGRQVAPWDYRVPGVTSISADIHKYGYCPKGASTLTYRSSDYRKYQVCNVGCVRDHSRVCC
jgi:glutamate/tyrosine decarboxylase-like PLP-dependent enzyme